jgi:hypothetical protein
VRWCVLDRGGRVLWSPAPAPRSLTESLARAKHHTNAEESDGRNTLRTSYTHTHTMHEREIRLQRDQKQCSTSREA